jgi:uncharacterized protein
MQSRLVPKAAFRAMPWRNGGGTTWEIAQGRFGAGEGWQWRLSLAEIATDGPFSVFPHIDRVLTVIDGAGVALRLDGVPPRVLRQGEDISFPGEAAVDCALLAGPTRDLNLMVDRRAARFRLGAPMVMPMGAVAVVYAFGDAVVISGQERVSVAAGDAWMGEGEGEVLVDGHVFRALISPLSAS